eukprot:Sdes_comp15942_c0_seq1m5085
MNIVFACKEYLTKIFNDISGMKVLLVDAETTGIVSMVYTQSEILQKEVFLVDRVDAHGREKMPHLKCIVFIRPTVESIHFLCEELKNPGYGQYYLYFSNILPTNFIERIAEADSYEYVREVQEYFADFIAIS